MKISKALWSSENPKAAKAEKFGWINAIHYMAPYTLGGVGNLCPWATEGCKSLCLGVHSGQASMVKGGDDATILNNVRLSRVNKAKHFMADRNKYMGEMLKQARKIVKKAKGVSVCFRGDGATDAAIVTLPFYVGNKRTTLAAELAEHTFSEYTKSVARMRYLAAGKLPSNVYYTFSRSESNEAECHEVLAMGLNVAVVFRDELPAEFMGVEVIDGDEHDLRHLDKRGVVVGLIAKGAKARRDTSGFVVA